jgi:hypothetical protein
MASGPTDIAVDRATAFDLGTPTRDQARSTIASPYSSS